MSSLEGLHDGDDRGSLGPVALPAADLEGGTRGGRPAGPRCSADRPSSPWTNPPAAGRPHAQPRSRAWSLLQASGQYPGGNDVIKQGLRDRLPVAPLDTTSQGKVRTLTASRPRSPRTRGTWSLEDGSIKRASTICSKARSPRPPRPAPGGCRPRAGPPTAEPSAWPPRGTHKAGTSGDGSRDSRSSSPWPCQAAIFCRPASIRAASPASSWAEPQVLHNQAYAVLLDRDLHRHGPRSSPDLAQKRAHTSTSYGLLVLHPPTPQYQRKLTPTSPKTTKVS